MRNVPIDIIIFSVRALVGSVYKNLFAVSLEWNEDRHLHIRFYLDRDPKEFDRDEIDSFCTEVLSNYSSNNDIKSVECEVIQSKQRSSDDEEFIFKRRV